MPDNLYISAFFEDRGHESFIQPLIDRLAAEKNRKPALNSITARGGHGKVMNELKLYRAAIQSGAMPLPDIIVIAIDANCKSYARTRQETAENLPPHLRDRAVIACPDPHIERWFFADQSAFHRVIGPHPQVKAKKCKQDYYKSILAKAVVDAGYPPGLKGLEFAKDIVNSLDLYRAGKAESSLGHFIQEFQSRL
jgi:hypothetical protein